MRRASVCWSNRILLRQTTSSPSLLLGTSSSSFFFSSPVQYQCLSSRCASTNQQSSTHKAKEADLLDTNRIKRPPNIFIQMTKDEIPIIVKEPNREIPVERLKYPLQEIPPSPNPSGYLPPLGNTDHLPFRFIRDDEERLPVTSALKNGRSRFVTILKWYRGDSEVRLLIYFFLSLRADLFFRRRSLPNFTDCWAMMPKSDRGLLLLRLKAIIDIC